MIRKTYGVSGLMDWTTQIKAGKATISVHFAGGALTAYGVTPATYSTTNPFFQTVIEHSDLFANGRISLIGQIEIAGEIPANVVKKKSAKGNAAETKPTEVVPAEAVAAEADNAEKGSEDVKVIDVGSKPDAVEYLKEQFPEKGYGAVKLRSKASFEAACAECGVKFVFTDEQE